MNRPTGGLRHLTPQQLQHPALAFEALTDAFDLQTCQVELWNILKAFLGSEEADELTAHQRSEYIFFYEKLSAAVEAIFILRQQHPAPVILFQPPSAA
jgi:hypothetical protein